MNPIIIEITGDKELDAIGAIIAQILFPIVTCEVDQGTCKGRPEKPCHPHCEGIWEVFYEDNPSETWQIRVEKRGATLWYARDLGNRGVEDYPLNSLSKKIIGHRAGDLPSDKPPYCRPCSTGIWKVWNKENRDFDWICAVVENVTTGELLFGNESGSFHPVSTLDQSIVGQRIGDLPPIYQQSMPEKSPSDPAKVLEAIAALATAIKEIAPGNAAVQKPLGQATRMLWELRHYVR